MQTPEIILILPDIRSAHNVGSLFRTADAAGVGKIYLVGITPAPVDRFGRARPDIAKTALGAEKSISWEAVPELVPLLLKLKKEGYTIIAIEQAENAVDYKTVQVSGRAAFVLGSEVEGVPKEALELCDIVAEIPMRGMKESLNVSVAGGVALFRMLGI